LSNLVKQDLFRGVHRVLALLKDSGLLNTRIFLLPQPVVKGDWAESHVKGVAGRTERWSPIRGWGRLIRRCRCSEA
jgi:hypothetical protein